MQREATVSIGHYPRRSREGDRDRERLRPLEERPLQAAKGGIDQTLKKPHVLQTALDDTSCCSIVQVI
jgi:hypothetical protein